MGSSGNGMFGTYRGGGAGSIVRGGNNGGDECPLAIENILLELSLIHISEPTRP